MILEARRLYSEGKYQESIEIINSLLDENPNDPQALFILGGIFIQTNKRGLAYNIFARVAKLAPERSEVWCQYGRCQDDNEEGWAKAEWCFRKSIEMHPSEAAWANLSSIYIQQCKPDEAIEYANESLKLLPNYNVAESCLGFAHLMKGDWEQGFKNYHSMLGHASRPNIGYGDLPEWDGSPGHTIVVNGEQGIGDELIYSSFIPDIAKNNRVVYDCMPRLKNLMSRSFGDNVYVVGGRWSSEIELPQDWVPTAKITQAGLGMFCRKTDSDFDGEPYLKADPDMRKAMRGLLDSLGDKPKVGIAWTGGTKQSRMQFRQRTLEGLTELLRNDKVTWVSLQYKDHSEEIEEFEKKRGIKIHHFPWVTEVKEYDYTAALINELDLVIAVPTSATQLAGALGKEAWVMVPKITGWLFNRDKYVWANSVKLYRDKPVKFIADELNRWLKK